MIDSDCLFWDSCCFIRYLSGVPETHVGSTYVDDLDAYIQDAKKRRRAIYFSTLVYAEIRPRYLPRKYGTIQKFFADLTGAFYPIEASPNIMIRAGELKDARSTNPSDPKKNNSREIGTPDSIHLMTAVYARDVLKMKDVVFHTLDSGKGTSWEGRCVPLLNLENWFPESKRTARVKEVCSLPRELPIYPQGNLLTGLGNTRATDSGNGPSPQPIA